MHQHMITDSVREIFQRSIALVGEENFIKVHRATVLVVGLGGVGGACAEAIARMGVSKILLCDHDIVDPTNINRQIIAFHSTVDSKKVDIMYSRIKDINPNCELERLDVKLGRENLSTLDRFQIDYIVDAIDSFDDKVALIQYAKAKEIPIISAMGSGGKLNPLAFKVADYKDTKYCRLARKLRKALKDLGIKELKVVYSEEESKNDFSKFDFVSSISFVPPVVGYVMASEVFKDLINYKGGENDFDLQNDRL